MNLVSRRSLKRSVAAFVLLFVAGAVITGFAQRSSLQQILERGTIRVGTTGDFNPFSFRDPRTGNYSGHDIELVTKLAEDMGVEVEFVATDWRNLVSGVAADKYDITTGASYNMGRAKTAGYTLPVIEVGTVPLMLRRNASKFDSWDDVDSRGVTVAVTLGTVFEDQARTLFENATIRRVEPPARDFQEVLAGRTEISITSTFEAASLVKQFPQLMIVPVEAPQFRNAIGILVAQDDQTLINYINVWITMQRYNGYLDELRNKWLPEREF